MRRHILIIALSMLAASMSAQTNYDWSKIQMEDLGRGVVAVRKNAGEVFVTWRYLNEDPSEVKFNIYRNGLKLNKKPLENVTFYVDSFSAGQEASYEVRSVIKKKET